MIFVSRAIPINEPGAARLDRAAVWEGLVRKANNALPFVPRLDRELHFGAFAVRDDRTGGGRKL